MFLGNLLKSIGKKYRKIPVKGISFDSRKVKKNHVFFAIKGSKKSGTKFINQALSRGASIIISDEKIKYKNKKTPFLLVKDARETLSEVSSNFYKKKPKNIIAVTGTNGKSSVVNFFHQLLNNNNIHAASIGTLGIFSKKFKKKTNLTSVDTLSLHENLQKLSMKQINHVALEASSHGLKQKRLNNLNINIGIFTNLSHDHLDYHKNMKEYLKSKMYLFETLLNKNSKIITDEDNKEFKILKKIAKKRNIKKITIGTKFGNLKILNNKYKEDKQIIKIFFNSKIYLFEIPLIGYFQIKNLLMAAIACLQFGLDEKKVFRQFSKIRPIPGRLECVANLKNNSKIIVDYAHTPDALRHSLIALKTQFKKNILLVFGCGGNRDKGKRLKMGRIARKYCRKVFVTDDNPRDENPKKIRNTIVKGCIRKAVNIASRKKAISMAIKELKEDEILLVAGKGHETIQDYGKKIIKFSDKKEIKKIVKKIKHSKKPISWHQGISKKVFNNSLDYRSVSIDSKKIKKNSLFFAIRGKNNDGHDYVKEALKRGAIKSIVSKKIKKISKNKIIKVKNTFSSLNVLAKVTRENSSANIIGITGSVGKTTLKKLISFALKNYGQVYHSPLSYNNKFGVPISLANLRNSTKYGVFEIGMNKKGEIDNLSKIVKPEIAIITNIAEAHFENFRTLKDIAKAKAEIIDNIVKGGSIVLNKDDKFYNFLSNLAKKKRINITSFSSKKMADIYLSRIIKIKEYYKLKIFIKNKIYYFHTNNSTESFINNILACISVLYNLNLDVNILRKKFVDFKTPEGRGNIKTIRKFNKKFQFINESYNANPFSMNSAIKNMNSYKRKKNTKKLAFLGDMLELGKKSKKFHKILSTVINKSDIDKVYVYGNHIKYTFSSLSPSKQGKVFTSLDDAYYHLAKIIHNNDLLMIKGSNATGLNRFSKNIIRGRLSAI